MNNECICEGNWRDIIKEYEHLFGKRFKRNDEIYTLCGILWGIDDFYYVMSDENAKMRFSTCVTSLEEMDYIQID